MSKEEYDRLMETSPAIPEEIIHGFKDKFNNSDAFKTIIKPEICDILIPTNDFRNPWFNEENKTKAQSEQLQIKITKEQKVKKFNELNNKMVKDFIVLFNDLNNRDPMDSEIIDNLRDKIDIAILQKIIDEQKSIEVFVGN